MLIHYLKISLFNLFPLKTDYNSILLNFDISESLESLLNPLLSDFRSVIWQELKIFHIFIK